MTATELAHRHLTSRRAADFVSLLKERISPLRIKCILTSVNSDQLAWHLTWFTEYPYILTSESINSKADVDEVSVLFE